jgi:hypothetical protein
VLGSVVGASHTKARHRYAVGVPDRIDIAATHGIRSASTRCLSPGAMGTMVVNG